MVLTSTELPSGGAPGGLACPPPDVSEKYLQKVISTFVFGEVPSKETAEKVAYVKTALEEYYRSKAPVRKENSLTRSSAEPVAPPLSSLSHIEGTTALCGGVESCNDAERSNLVKEVSSMLKGGIRKLKKEGSWGRRKSRPISFHEITAPFNVQHSSHVGFSKAGELEMQNLPLQLQTFVDNINESLHKLGAANLTEEELKLLLATAPLPDLDSDSSGARSRSGSLDSVGSESSSSGYDGDISPRDNPTQQHSDNAKDKVKKTKRKITHFISKKVSSFTNLLEISKEDGFEISTPTRFVKTGGFDFGGDSPSTLKLKLELAEKAKRDEEALRREAEEKLTSMEELAYKLRSELENTQAHSSTIKSLLTDANKRVDEYNKSKKMMESEMGMLRSKNVGSISKQQSAERALGDETKKRRVLEIRIAELQDSLKNFEEKGKAHGKQQEEVTTVMEKLRQQMEIAEKDTETMKNAWCGERAKMLEEHEQLRKQIDLLRDLSEKDKAYFSLVRKQWLEDIEASKAEACAKVEEATKLLDAERKQHRVDKIRLEQLQETNETLVRAVAEANAQQATPCLLREDISSNSVTAFVPPVPTVPPPPLLLRVTPLSLPLPLPLPTKPAEDHFSSLKESIQIGQARLAPAKKDIKKEAPKTNLDLLAYAIIARRQRIVEEEEEEEHNPDFD